MRGLCRTRQTRRADLDFAEFDGAENNFDDPSKKKQANPANQRATVETRRRADRLFAEHLRR
jgi:hypothetical protein